LFKNTFQIYCKVQVLVRSQSLRPRLFASTCLLLRSYVTDQSPHRLADQSPLSFEK